MPFDWENIYLTNAPEALPWNAGKPDRDLERLIKEGAHRLPGRQALDIGTGPGHDAVFLIQQGFDVIAIDISPSAIQLARENASHHGLFGFFQQGDLRQIPVEDGWIDFAHDRGCFHILDPEDQPQAVREIARVLKPQGLFLIKLFKEAEATLALFDESFKRLEKHESVFEGAGQRLAISALLQKR